MEKIALITGAGSGVGRATSIKLSAAGVQVILVGRRRDKLEETRMACQHEAFVCPLNVSLENEVHKCFQKVEKKFLRLDLLFNNAGIFLPSKTIDQISFREWQEVINVNINGMFLFSKYAFSLMKRQSPMGGRIINNGSVSAYTPRPGSTAYTTTKHAVTGMTKTISLDGRPFNIVSSQIDIGNADTPMTEGIKNGITQPDGTIEKEPVFDAEHVADAILSILNLPLDTNVLNMTIMASKMPFLGRG